MCGEKARWGLHTNATCYFLQILDAKLHPPPPAIWPSYKPSKLDEQDMKSTAGQVRTNS